LIIRDLSKERGGLFSTSIREKKGTMVGLASERRRGEDAESIGGRFCAATLQFHYGFREMWG